MNVCELLFLEVIYILKLKDIYVKVVEYNICIFFKINEIFFICYNIKYNL